MGFVFVQLRPQIVRHTHVGCAEPAALPRLDVAFFRLRHAFLGISVLPAYTSLSANRSRDIVVAAAPQVHSCLSEGVQSYQRNSAETAAPSSRWSRAPLRINVENCAPKQRSCVKSKRILLVLDTLCHLITTAIHPSRINGRRFLAKPLTRAWRSCENWPTAITLHCHSV
jgi:hypothetical protein